MFTVPVHSTSNSDYSFLNYEKKIPQPPKTIQILPMHIRIHILNFIEIRSGVFEITCTTRVRPVRQTSDRQTSDVGSHQVLSSHSCASMNAC